jgi:flagellar biosynthesis/type III secretory pathway chaperone
VSPASPISLIPDLTRLLQAELETLRALCDALDGEYSALTSADVGALETATHGKTQAVESHRAQQQQRLTWMTEAGLDRSVPLGDLLNDLGARDTNLADLSAQLSALATRCQDSNRRNGTLITRLQSRTRGALDVLRGAEPAGDLYSLSGARDSGSDSKSLGKA